MRRRRPVLYRLARRVGILREHLDASGTERQVASDETLVALLDAMGLDGCDEAAAASTLRRLEQRDRPRVLAPVRVMRPAGCGGLHLRFQIPEEFSGPIEWSAEISNEKGQTDVQEGQRTGQRGSRFVRVFFPRNRQIGYHELGVAIRGSQSEVRANQLLVVAPSKCCAVADRLKDRRVYGVCANLYTMISRRNWGIGDLSDLTALARWCAEEGGAFVGINPLHATPNRSGHVSPYSPISRLFRNIVYLDVDAIPEFRTAPAARQRTESRRFKSDLSQVRASARVEYEKVASLKLGVLRGLHKIFSQQTTRGFTARAKEYAQFVSSQGALLTDFATFCALSNRFDGRSEGRVDWRTWPASYRHPRSTAVEGFRRSHMEAVDFYRYLQFEMERQLAHAAQTARSAGLKLGLYQDLAVGSMPGGFDSWAFPSLFITNASVGAPPDAFFRTGQDWGLPPLDPFRLQGDRFRYWISLLRSNLAHSGALRIDHVMGLDRLYWIPKGFPPTRGAYVTYPFRELMAILALESVRAGAMIIGEDLGTVPRGFAALLARYGVLSSRVLYFQRNRKGAFLSSRSYSKRALVTASTHDHVPLAGFWNGRDLEIHLALGLNPQGKDFGSMKKSRDTERQALLRRLRMEGAVRAGETGRPYAQLGRAVHQFLCKTPAPLVGLMLDDIVGETEPLNVPGVGAERYPSWTRRMKLAIEDFSNDRTVLQTMEGARLRRWRR